MDKKRTELLLNILNDYQNSLKATDGIQVEPIGVSADFTAAYLNIYPGKDNGIIQKLQELGYSVIFPRQLVDENFSDIDRNYNIHEFANMDRALIVDNQQELTPKLAVEIWRHYCSKIQDIGPVGVDENTAYFNKPTYDWIPENFMVDFAQMLNSIGFDVSFLDNDNIQVYCDTQKKGKGR